MSKQRRLSIRSVLLLTISTLTLIIIILAMRDMMSSWQKLQKVEVLQGAIALSDILFDSTEKLSVERDVAVSMLHASDPEVVERLQPRLEESRRYADQSLARAWEALEAYTFPELLELRHKMEVHRVEIQKLRNQIDANVKAGIRDPALSSQWTNEITVLMLQAEDLWVEFIRHFTDINPVVTQHLRFKHFMRIISDYNGRERAIVGRLLVENSDPTPEEFKQLLEGKGVIEISWRISRTLAYQSNLFPAIGPAFKKAQERYAAVHDRIEDMFYAPGKRNEKAQALSVEAWLDISAQSSESLNVLEEVALKQSRAYVDHLSVEMQHEIVMRGLLLLLAIAVSTYSFWIILHRVLHPIHRIVEALVGATQGQNVSFDLPLNQQDEIGQLANVLRVFQDNRERLVDSANRLNAVFDTVLDGLITIDSHGSIQSFNSSAERIFGYTAEEVIGRNVNMLMPEPYHHEHDSYISNYLRTGEAKIIGIGREVTAKRKDGSIFPMELGINEFRIGAERAFVGMIRDITQRKEAEANIKRYLHALERSNKELDDFAYIASHDLKEPLRGLHNHARFLLEDNAEKLDEDSTSRLNRLVYLSQRMEKLVNDLLYFSRLGRQELAIGAADMNDIIHDVTDTLDTFLDEYHAKVTIPTPLPTIVCDKIRIAEVFRNLIINAAKYNDKEEKIIEIGFLEKHNAPSGIALENVFYVKDNGVGIAPEFYEDVFRIFKRLQSNKGKQEDGTGVGLTFTKKIIERHNGKIWLESRTGQGTTFYFTLGGPLHD